MTDRMTPQQLADLAELRAKVTPGPWVVHVVPDEEIHIRPFDCDPDSWVPIASRDMGLSDDVDMESRANFALIAMVPQLADDVVALTAELARVTAERDDADIECGGYIGMLDRARDNLAAAEATIAALTTELAEATDECRLLSANVSAADEAMAAHDAELARANQMILNERRIADAVIAAQDAELARLEREAVSTEIDISTDPDDGMTSVTFLAASGLTTGGVDILKNGTVCATIIHGTRGIASDTARILAALEPAQPDAGVSVADAAKVILACHTVQTMADAGIAMDLVDTLRALAQSDAARPQGEKA